MHFIRASDNNEGSKKHVGAAANGLLCFDGFSRKIRSTSSGTFVLREGIFGEVQKHNTIVFEAMSNYRHPFWKGAKQKRRRIGENLSAAHLYSSRIHWAYLLLPFLQIFDFLSFFKLFQQDLFSAKVQNFFEGLNFSKATLFFIFRAGCVFIYC